MIFHFHSTTTTYFYESLLNVYIYVKPRKKREGLQPVSTKLFLRVYSIPLSSFEFNEPSTLSLCIIYWRLYQLSYNIPLGWAIFSKIFLWTYKVNNWFISLGVLKNTFMRPIYVHNMEICIGVSSFLQFYFFKKDNL